jgi:hypothetical protein
MYYFISSIVYIENIFEKYILNLKNSQYQYLFDYYLILSILFAGIASTFYANTANTRGCPQG